MLRIVPHAVPRAGRSYEHFPDGFELHLLRLGTVERAKRLDAVGQGKEAPGVGQDAYGGQARCDPITRVSSL